MAKVQYESKDDSGHRFWTARYGRYAIRIDANRPGLYRWVITLEGRSIRKGTAPSRDEAADAVSQALEELPGEESIPSARQLRMVRQSRHICAASRP
jgi:hypothetical protein